MTHPSHKTRCSDASTYDEVCEYCGATDAAGSRRLRDPCPDAPAPPPTHPERAAFEATIRADRYDQTARLVFADWLDEHGLHEDADFQRAWTPAWQQAEDRLKAFCERVDLNYPYFLREALRHLTAGTHYAIPVTMTTSNATLDEDMAPVWADVGVVLRREVEAGKATDPFTCGGDCYPAGVSWGDDADGRA